MKRSSILLVALLAGTGASTAAADAKAAEHCDHAAQAPAAGKGYTRSLHRYEAPAVTLTDQEGRAVPIAQALQPDAPLALNFIFTTCSTICPVLSATLSRLRAALGPRAAGLKMVSIDPERDRPAVLKAYAARYHAGQDWQFYTGTEGDIQTVLRAFDAFAGGKANHRPITLLRLPRSREWIRIEGFASAGELAGEIRELRAER
jgi:protein SCO1/2